MALTGTKEQREEIPGSLQVKNTRFCGKNEKKVRITAEIKFKLKSDSKQRRRDWKTWERWWIKGELEAEERTGHNWLRRELEAEAKAAARLGECKREIGIVCPFCASVGRVQTAKAMF